MKRRASKAVWTDSELESLRTAAHGLRAELGRALGPGDLKRIRIPGRSYAAVKSQAARMRLYEPARRAPKWKPREEQLLVLLTKTRGLTARGIKKQGFFAPDGRTTRERSIDSIAQKMRREGLADPRRSRRSRYARRLTKEEQRTLRADLRRYRTEKTTAEIAHEYGVAPSTIRRYRKKWKIPFGWKTAMALPEALERRRTLGEQTTERNHERWARAKSELRATLEKKRDRTVTRARKEGRDIDMRRCECCGEEWPATSSYFAASPKRSGGKVVKVYLRRTCRLCPRRRA